MLTKDGKLIAAGTTLVCVNDMERGFRSVVERKFGQLVVTDSHKQSLPLKDFASENGHLIDYISAPFSFERSTYESRVEAFQNLNLTDIQSIYDIDEDELDEDQIARLLYYGYERNECDNCYTVSAVDMVAAKCENVPYAEVWTDDDEDTVEHVMSWFIKPAKHYLVFAFNCRWNGASGYSIVDDIKDTIHRSYDVTITPRHVSRYGKTLICRESSHDVPTGAETIIIALTDAEYRKLSEADFETVQAFANHMTIRARHYDE